MFGIDRDKLSQVDHANNFFVQGLMRMDWGATGVNGIGERLEPGPAAYYLWYGYRQVKAALRFNSVAIRTAHPELYAIARTALLLSGEQVQSSEYIFNPKRK